MKCSVPCSALYHQFEPSEPFSLGILSTTDRICVGCQGFFFFAYLSNIWNTQCYVKWNRKSAAVSTWNRFYFKTFVCELLQLYERLNLLFAAGPGKKNCLMFLIYAVFVSPFNDSKEQRFNDHTKELWNKPNSNINWAQISLELWFALTLTLKA